MDCRCCVFVFDSARTVYTIPGGGVRAEEVVRQLARQAVEEGLPLYFYGIVPELRELLDKVFPEVFEYNGKPGSFRLFVSAERIWQS